MLHTTNNENMTDIDQSKAPYFGIFASCDDCGHGAVSYEIEIDGDTARGLYDIEDSIIESVIRNETSAETEEEIGAVVEALEDDANECEFVDSWEFDAGLVLQGLKSKIAIAAGFAAIEMQDEHGTSTLINKAKSIKKI